MYKFLLVLLLSNIVPSYGVSSMEKKEKFVGVGGIFIQDNKVLFVFRENTGKNDNLYGLIGGLVKENESVKEGLIREIDEEVGVKVNPQDMRLVHCISSRENGIETVGCYFLIEKWIGTPFNKASHKHNHVKWFDLKNLPQNLIPRNRQAVELMEKGITYSEYGW